MTPAAARHAAAGLMLALPQGSFLGAEALGVSLENLPYIMVVAAASSAPK